MHIRDHPELGGRDIPKKQVCVGPGSSEEVDLIADRRSEVLGCRVNVLDMSATLSRCLALIEQGDGAARQVSINAAKVVECSRDPRLTAFVNDCEVVSADGQAVVWASRLLGRPLPERVAGIDLMQRLIEEATTRGLSVYFLGAKQSVLEQAVAGLRRAHPGLRVAGAHHGYFSRSDESAIVRGIHRTRADILFVAMSSPHKELWLDRHASDCGVGFAMGVGGAIDVIAGERVRAPRWMQRLGLEWFHRLRQEPVRMWKRYLVGNFRFVALLAKELVRTRLLPKVSRP